MTVFLPLFLGAVNPLFHVPLDGSAEVFGPDGKTIATGVVQGRSEYQPGVAGQALDVQRRAPDQVTTAVFNRMPAINCNSGTVAFWFKPSDTENFTPIQLGTSWESQGHQQENPHYRYPVDTQESQKLPYDGFAWYRCTVKIPESWQGHAIRLIGGPIDDCDWTWWNGTEIGKTTLANNPNSYSARRDYPIPEELVKFGQENTLMIKVFDRWGEGGVLGGLKVVAEERDSKPSWSPYVDALDFYDVDAFHNW